MRREEGSQRESVNESGESGKGITSTSSVLSDKRKKPQIKYAPHVYKEPKKSKWERDIMVQSNKQTKKIVGWGEMKLGSKSRGYMGIEDGWDRQNTHPVGKLVVKGRKTVGNSSVRRENSTVKALLPQQPRSQAHVPSPYPGSQQTTASSSLSPPSKAVWPSAADY